MVVLGWVQFIVTVLGEPFIQKSFWLVALLKASGDSKKGKLQAAQTYTVKPFGSRFILVLNQNKHA